MVNRGPKPLTIEQTIHKIANNTIIVPHPKLSFPCKLWQGHRTRGGYGLVSYHAKQVYIHRFIYHHCIGEIPEGELVCHECDRPNCWEETHLFVGTNAANQADKVSKRRQSRGESHYRSKITAIQADEIRISTEDCGTLSRRYGISRGGIQNIRKERTWKV